MTVIIGYSAPHFTADHVELGIIPHCAFHHRLPKCHLHLIFVPFMLLSLYLLRLSCVCLLQGAMGCTSAIVFTCTLNTNSSHLLMLYRFRRRLWNREIRCWYRLNGCPPSRLDHQERCSRYHGWYHWYLRPCCRRPCF